jgi:hypothetical protein
MKILLGSAAALSLLSGVALAQTAYQSTTTQTTSGVPPVSVQQPVTPPMGTLSTTRETSAVDAYGDRRTSKSTIYRDANGVAEDRSTTTTTVAAPPPPPPVTTTTTTTESSTTGPQ